MDSPEELRADIPIVLHNATCPYCGVGLNDEIPTKDHVIGRRFVPRGTLDQAWNLVVFACGRCNGAKGDLEDDLSALSMQPDGAGHLARDDDSLRTEASRKAAGSVSRLSGRPVGDSLVTARVSGSPVPGVTMSFTGRAPPQLSRDRVFDLAWFQLCGFFYWLTFDPEPKVGGLWVGDYLPRLFSLRGDWGNSRHRAFMTAVAGWEPWLLAETAKGFFKVAIRRFPESICWSWALEWNKNVRVIGFCGDRVPVERVVGTFPDLHETRVAVEGGGELGIRLECPLPPDEDLLFSRCER
jgi:hypothetical protein